MVMSYVGMLFNLRMFMLEFLLIYLFSLETSKLFYEHILLSMLMLRILLSYFILILKFILKVTVNF